MRVSGEAKRLRVTVSAASYRASASARSSTGSRGRGVSPASSATTAAVSSSRSRARRTSWSDSSRPFRRRRRRSRPSTPCRVEELATRGEESFRIVESAQRPGADDAGKPRRVRVRRLSARALRPRRPSVPLSVPQLHELWPEVHDRPVSFPTTARTRRCGASRCARTVPPSTTTRRTVAFTPSPTHALSCGPRLWLTLAEGRSARARGGNDDGRARSRRRGTCSRETKWSRSRA